MAKIFELVGSPGVGKTTLYRKLESLWNKDCNWMPSQYFYPRKKIITNSISSWVLNIIEHIKDRRGLVDVKAMERAGGRFVEMYPAYMDICWKSINCMYEINTNSQDLRFQKVSYLYKLIQKIQTLREQDSDKVAIVDEGLIHIINSVLFKKEVVSEEKEDIEHLFGIIPLPDGIISIETDVHENVKRLTHRKKIIPMHKSLEESELEKAIRLDYDKRAVVNAVIQSKKIPFLQIDSKDTIATNISKIIAFTEKKQEPALATKKAQNFFNLIMLLPLCAQSLDVC